MRKIQAINYRDLLSENLKNEEFKTEYSKLEEEFTIAKEVIKLRKKMKMTQAELAKKAGTSQPAIARLESGEYRNISLSFINRIAEALNAKPEIHLRHVR